MVHVKFDLLISNFHNSLYNIIFNLINILMLVDKLAKLIDKYNYGFNKVIEKI